jgi:DNA-directed RNA polymerase subunit RPC12/RpoP
MTEDYDNDLLREGILHFKAKDYAMARRYFERALDTADDLQTQAQANYYLSQVVDDPKQKRQFLEETLANDMGHAAARRALAILDGKLNPAEIVNPDTLPTPVPGVKAVQAIRYTCPKCGGRMLYAPDGASLVCEDCSRQQSLKTSTPGAEQDFFVAMANGKGFRKAISVKTFQCQGCGANFLLAPSELSATCAYCGSVHVIVMETVRELVEPDAIIPMAVVQKQAGMQLVQWVEKKHLQPQGKVGTPRGLYLPVWAFDLIGDIPWSGRVIRDKREVPIPAKVLPCSAMSASPPRANWPACYPNSCPNTTSPPLRPTTRASWPAGPPRYTRRPCRMPPWRPASSLSGRSSVNSVPGMGTSLTCVTLLPPSRSLRTGSSCCQSG